MLFEGANGMMVACVEGLWDYITGMAHEYCQRVGYLV